MRHANRTARVAKLAEPPPASQRSPRAQPAALGLVALRLLRVDAEAATAVLAVGDGEAPARIDQAVDAVVLQTALARGERVIAQHEEGAWCVLGVLRTSATPGLDKGDDYVIEARRVRVVTEHELSLRAGNESMVVNAARGIELLAGDITARAAHVCKVIGRVLRLN
jgi:hypothetical protein